MYTLVKSYAQPVAEGAEWLEPDLGDVICSKLFSTYRKIYLVLSNPYLDHQVTLDLDTVVAELRVVTVSLNSWLFNQGNRAFATVDGVPVLKKAKLYVGDAYQAGYRVKPTSHRVHPDTPLSIDQQHDLLLLRDKADYLYMQDHCLAAVNGYVHRTSSSEDGFYILNGADTGTKTRSNQISLYNFQELGKVEQLTITEDMIVYPVNNLALVKKVWLKLPKPVVGKTVGLVIAGFLQLLDGVVEKVADDVVVLNLARLPWLERVAHIESSMDLTGCPTDFYTDGRRVLEEVESDAFVKWVLKLPQTFLFTIENANLQAERQVLEDLKIPGRWLAHEYPVGYIQIAGGYTPNCLVIPEGGRYAVVAKPVYDEGRLRERHGFREHQVYTDTIDVASYRRPAPATLVRVVSTTIEIKG